MSKKQISNFLEFLPNFLKQNLYKRIKRIVLAFFVAFLFVSNIAFAQGPLPPTQTPPINPAPTGSSSCDLTKLSDANAKVDYAFQPSDSGPINPEQVFQIGIKITNITDQQLAAACYQSQNLKISAEFYLYQCLRGLDYISCNTGVLPSVVAIATGILEGSGKVIKESSGTAIGIGGVFAPTKLTDIMKNRVTGNPLNFASVLGPIVDKGVSIPNPNNYYVYVYPEVSISDTNKVKVPFNDSYAFWRQVKLDAPVGAPGAISSDFAPETETTVKDDNLTSKLFNFIRSVIAYIVLLLTGLIYYIFSFILVPVLVALLQIQAYRDTFVNFIYPGWVIIRNISNIFFIVALLWIGLRTLFQVDDASKSRSLIVRLILMALLVNFSLVIGQAIVGIADTVQAQFLPKDSTVVEALGQKLMVDPIITFRGGAADKLDPVGNFTEDAFASDLPKAIVLLVLAVAAFFAFVALIAFIFVRLGMLWILYMLSPLAYVAQILPETQKFGKQWFTEFLRYAFVVPILAFFLNITALMAVTFSKQSGDQAQVAGAGREYLLGHATAGIVEFAVTVMSHFIVLVFLFGGMVFAQRFGGVGSQQIVSFAKKGFDAVTKRPVKWAARGVSNMASSMAKEKYERSIAGGLFDPAAWKQAIKDRVAKTTENEKLERLSKKGNKLTPGNIIPETGSLGDRAKHIKKYMLAKIMRQDPHRLLATANAELEKASIMTAGELSALQSNLVDHTNAMTQAEAEIDLLAKDSITDARANEYDAMIRDKIAAIDARSKDLMKKKKKVARGGEEDQQIDKELAGLVEDKKALINAQTALANARASSAARGAGPGTVKFDAGELDALKVVFDKEALKNELSDTLKKASDMVEKDQKKLDKDEELRRKYNTAVMTEAERLDLQKSAALKTEKANATLMPLSQAAIAARRLLQNAEAKKIENIDDVDALVEAHKSALAANNTALAVEIQKKLAKIGGLDELLKSAGYSNNLKDFQQFIEKTFSKLAPQVRVQIGSEISQVAKTNGNLTLGNSANYSYNKNTGEVTVKWAPPEESMRKLNAKLKSTPAGSLATMQKTDLAFEEAGMHKLHDGVIENLNSMNAQTLNNFIRRSSPSLRQFILKAANSARLSNTVRARLA